MDSATAGPSPRMSLEDVQQLRDQGRLVFIVDGKVYSVDDDFLHPGGLDVLVLHSGTDITRLFRGHAPGGHSHSASSHALLSSYYLADLSIAVAEAESDGTNAAANEPTGLKAVIDETQPLLWQVSSLGPRYMEWVHSPVAGRPRFFRNDWAEAVTKVNWWVVPLLWLPLVVHSLVLAAASLQWAMLAVLVVAGVVAWQGMEYAIHRYLFHNQPTRPATIFLHFLIHGCHHKYPMDTERLVFPPLPASWVIGAVYAGLHAVAPRDVALALFGGMLFGYVAYDCMHYFMHSGVLGGPLKAAHMRHHYTDPDRGYGISSPLFDIIAGTASFKAFKTA